MLCIASAKEGGGGGADGNEGGGFQRPTGIVCHSFVMSLAGVCIVVP